MGMAKRPIVLTCRNAKGRHVQDILAGNNVRYQHVNLRRPSVLDITLQMGVIAASEGISLTHTHGDGSAMDVCDLSRLAALHGCDLRRSMAAMQFWYQDRQGGASRRAGGKAGAKESTGGKKGGKKGATRRGGGGAAETASSSSSSSSQRGPEVLLRLSGHADLPLVVASDVLSIVPVVASANTGDGGEGEPSPVLSSHLCQSSCEWSG